MDFDPADGFLDAIRSLAPIAELFQSLDGGLVSFQIESIDGNLHWIRRRFRRSLQYGCSAVPGKFVWDEARHKDAAAIIIAKAGQAEGLVGQFDFEQARG